MKVSKTRAQKKKQPAVKKKARKQSRKASNGKEGAALQTEVVGRNRNE